MSEYKYTNTDKELLEIVEDIMTSVVTICVDLDFKSEDPDFKYPLFQFMDTCMHWLEQWRTLDSNETVAKNLLKIMAHPRSALELQIIANDLDRKILGHISNGSSNHSRDMGAAAAVGSGLNSLVLQRIANISGGKTLTMSKHKVIEMMRQEWSVKHLQLLGAPPY
jgi:6-phosphofructokinase